MQFESPAVAGAPAPTSGAATSAPAQPKPPSKHATVALPPLWDTRMQGGAVTMKELRSLLSRECTPAVDLSGYDIDIYHGVRYLMEAGQAARILGVSGSIPSTAKVATPGFPRDGLSYIAYDGNFEKHYNRVYLVTDAGDKVVCIQFVDEHPTSGGGGANGDWNTYNFVNTRLRASAAIGVRNESRREGDIIHIDTHAYQHGREFENTKLLIPIPFARLILHCIDVGLAKP